MAMRRLLLMAALGASGTAEVGTESSGLLQKTARSAISKAESATTPEPASADKASCPSFETSALDDGAFADAVSTTSSTTMSSLPLEHCPSPAGAFATCSLSSALRDFAGSSREIPVGLHDVAKSTDGYLQAQAMFCNNGRTGNSIHGLALRFGVNRITFLRSQHVEALLPGERLFDFVGTDNLTTKDAVDIRVNDRSLDWDKFASSEDESSGRGQMLGSKLWLQQMEGFENAMVPTCLGDAHRTMTMRFALPSYHRLFEPLLSLQISQDTVDGAGLCGGELRPATSWDESLFSLEEQRQLCEVCGLDASAGCSLDALRTEAELRSCQAKVGDETFDDLQASCEGLASADEATCVLKRCSSP